MLRGKSQALEKLSGHFGYIESNSVEISLKIAPMPNIATSRNSIEQAFRTNLFFGLAAFLVFTSFLAWMPPNNDAFWVNLVIFPWVMKDGLVQTMVQSIAAASSLGRPPIPMFLSHIYTWFQIKISSNLGIEWVYINWITTALFLYGVFYFTAQLITRIIGHKKENTPTLAVTLGLFALPFIVSNSSYYHDPTGSYFVFAWLLNILPVFGFLCLRIYMLNGTNKRFLYFFMFFVFISINSSEANFISSVLLIAYAIVSTRKMISKSNLKSLSFFYSMVIICVFSLWYWIERNLSGNAQSGYSGIQSNFELSAIGKTFLLQLFYNLPTLSFLGSSQKRSMTDLPINDLHVITLFIIVGLILMLLWIVWKIDPLNLKNSDRQTTRNLFEVGRYRVEVIGLTVILGANLLTYSVSSKYQSEVPLFSSFYLGLGVVAVTLSLITYIMSLTLSSKFKGKVLDLAILLGSVQLILNCYVSMQLQANQPFLRPAQKIISDIEVTQVEYCLAINGVKAGNYGGLGEASADILRKEAQLDKSFEEC
jgi:hypothetical protein